MSKGSYIRGFCKAAEAVGVDPKALAKFAQQSINTANGDEFKTFWDVRQANPEDARFDNNQYLQELRKAVKKLHPEDAWLNMPVHEGTNFLKEVSAPDVRGDEFKTLWDVRQANPEDVRLTPWLSKLRRTLKGWNSEDVRLDEPVAEGTNYVPRVSAYVKQNPVASTPASIAK